jgi:hypothetical protein
MGFPSPAIQFPETLLCAVAQGSLLRRALPYGLFPENSTTWIFQTGSVAGEDARRHRKKILPNEPKSSQMRAPY